MGDFWRMKKLLSNFKLLRRRRRQMRRKNFRNSILNDAQVASRAEPYKQIFWSVRQWRGSVGRVVASDTRYQWFESRHQQTFVMYLFTVNCVEKTKMKKKNILVGSGCGSVGWVVTSDGRGLLFESSHWQTFMQEKICLLSTEMKKIKKRGHEWPIF